MRSSPAPEWVKKPQNSIRREGGGLEKESGLLQKGKEKRRSIRTRLATYNKRKLADGGS